MRRSVAWSVLSIALVLILFPSVVASQDHKSKPTADAKDKQTTKEVKAVDSDINNSETVVLSGIATTARIADPNERVFFSGRVMRMADYVAAVSSSTEAIQHLRNLEKHNREKDQPVQPSKPTS
jgi:hypothetical protein